MAVSVARVRLAVAHAALPALFPTPPKWKMLPLLPTPPPPPCVADSLLSKPSLAKPSRADSDERWDKCKAKPLACLASSASSSSSSSPRSADSVRSSAGRGSSRKNATSPPKPGRADAVERWDAHKKAASTASSSSSSSGTSSLASSSKKEEEEEEEEILWKPRAMYAGSGFVVAVPEPSMIPMPTALLVHVT